MKEIQHSTTQEIERSKINLNPYNPKRHSDREVKEQVKNIKRNGYLGGIVWNRQSGNLIDGHRRVKALDIIHKYDGTEDYTLKVEVVDFDEQTELEQMTYMATQNSKADYNLIAEYFEEIDPANIGLSEDEIKMISDLTASTENSEMEDLSDVFLVPRYEVEKQEMSFDEIAEVRETQPHKTKEEVKAIKENNNRIAYERNAANKIHILLEFDSAEDYTAFCETMGYMPQENMIISGLELLERFG